MNMIELHILQSFPVSCLNRDDVGAPKTALFGGVQRARVSSQSWKRAIRFFAKDLQPHMFDGKRSRYVLNELRRLLQTKGCSQSEANIIVEQVAGSLGKLDNLEKGNVKTMLFFSPQQLKNFADALFDEAAIKAAKTLSTESSTKKEKEKAQKQLGNITGNAAKKLSENVKDAADIAIFGRMVADDHSLTVEGAGLFSHALSTHRVDNEIDFFSAVDDLKPEDTEGAGHIGTLEFNSACYYRYIGLNLDLLNDRHLKHFSDKELKSVQASFIRAAILAVPGARKNSMFGFNPPGFVLGLRREGQPISLVNAFEKAIWPSGNGYLQPSAEALKDHYRQLKMTYSINTGVETSIPNVDLDNLVANLVDKKSDDKTVNELRGN